MSVLFFDGFDYGVPMVPRYTALSLTNGFTTDSGRRTNTGALELETTSDYVTRELGASSATIIVGMAVKGYSDGSPLIELYEGATKHITIEFGASPNYYVTVKRGDGTTIYTGSTATDPGAWSYLEFRVTVDNAAGAITVVKDDVTIGSASSLDTRNGGTSGLIDTIKLRGTHSGSVWIDDLYVVDTTDSTAPTTFLGQTTRVDVLTPKSDYADDFQPSSGSWNYQLVDESEQDGDTSYVSSGSALARDLYFHSPLNYTPVNIYGVELCAVARVDSTSGSLTFANSMRPGGYYDGTAYSLDTTYGMISHLWTTNPSTLEDWTRAEVNALKGGFKIVTI